MTNNPDAYVDRPEDSAGNKPDGSLNDPWVYMAEIAHRTINEYTIAIAMISQVASRALDDPTRSMLRAVELRLRNAARMQGALASPPRAGAVDLADYLQPLCKAISAFALEERGIFLTLSCEPISLNPTQCWRFGLIVSELVMNARRHAFTDGSGQIRIEVMREGSQIHCRIVDNGVGLKAFIPGRGSQLVEALAADLGATIDRPLSETGTSVQLLFSPD